MKMFKCYNPIKIAMYVKALFSGTFCISHMGEFKFDKSKILLPKTHDKRYLSVMSEVNKQVRLLRQNF